MTTLDRSNVHLLLVEDNPRYLDELIDWLEEEFGYQHIETASNVAEARTKLDEKPFDVIVADMRLEGDEAGGFKVLYEKVTERNISSVIIILTANDTVADCRRAFKEKAWDYISKSMKGNVFEVLDQSILDAITYFNLRGDDKDEEWIEQNMESLLASYAGQYIAVINNSVIEVAGTEEALKQRLEERQLPVFVPTIKKIELSLEEPLSAKLTIFVEGPTDVHYIKKAATILGKEALLQEVDLDTIGDQTGQRGSGWKPMAQGFDFLKNNPSLRPNKVLFLCDQDVRDRDLPNKGKDFENLLVRRIDDHSPEKKGIEWLFADSIFEEGFREGLVQKDLGRATVDNPNPEPTYIIKDGDKIKFCRWICNERENTPEDFSDFKKIFDMIEEIISE